MCEKNGISIKQIIENKNIVKFVKIYENVQKKKKGRKEI